MAEATESKALFRAFVACLIVASLPIKNLAYITPALYLGILWLHGETRVLRRTAVLCSGLLLVSFFAVLWDHLDGQTVNLPGVWFGLLTHAPLIVLLCETFGRTIDQSVYDRFAKACVWFVLFQSFVGFVQFAVSRNPDAVCGTFGLLDGFRQTITIAQVYFTFTLFGMILFLIPATGQPGVKIAMATGVVICILAQSGHQTMFFVVTLILCGLARISRLGTLSRAVAAAAVVSALVLQIYPDTLSIARDWYHKVTDTSNSPKRMVYEGAVAILDDPKNVLIGTGLGQYSSRAALITSDEYLNVKLPGFMAGSSDYFSRYIRPSLDVFEDFGEGSAIAKPYMSLITLPVELGIVLSVALLMAVGRNALWCIRIMSSGCGQAGRIGFAMLVGIIFFLLCCTIENYAEFSQAVFAPFILFVVAGSRTQTVLRRADSVEPAQWIRTSYGLAARPLPR
jgi:hypothetical protein